MPPPPETTPRRARRLRRALACAVSIAALMLTTAGTGHADPYAAPAAVPSMAPATLALRYATERRSIEEALRTARSVGDGGRARALGAFLAPDRRFLYFDPRGAGRAIEVVGDLAHARRIAVLVPGADTTLTAFDKRGHRPWSTPGGGARAVYARAHAITADPGLAVVAWLGYAAPKTFSGDVLTDQRAGEGAGELLHFLSGMRRANPSARVALLCHSYGSVVCGRAALDDHGGAAAAWRQVTDIALYGSPGTTAWSAADLGGTARVWAGRGATDWMEDVPHVRILGLGLGPDPVSRGFGARVFAAGSGGHSDYLAPGSLPLRNLTEIALGDAPAVVRG
ncbi:alpha/beta hydrolase [Actinomadura verrucosospora]|uniref:Membrane protein n=1 Tax=Actinomadura verrucosospora TaxID=46165 RepID=A0A7D3VXC7_ACTVE|nr:alpha/beta hydrolase [Actinomadura verrucosospora]QKG21132.1 membrane protein [Actinomadura verrucosospora]